MAFVAGSSGFSDTAVVRKDACLLARSVTRPRARAPRMMVKSDGVRPPIDLPSGVLLMVSSVLAIASVGSVFELTSGHPQYGTPLTAAILATSFPGFLFMFWATLQKGKAEESE